LAWNANRYLKLEHVADDVDRVRTPPPSYNGDDPMTPTEQELPEEEFSLLRMACRTVVWLVGIALAVVWYSALTSKHTYELQDVLLYSQSIAADALFAIDHYRAGSPNALLGDAGVLHLFVCSAPCFSSDYSVGRQGNAYEEWICQSGFSGFGGVDLGFMCDLGICISIDTWSWGRYCEECILKVFTI
jgi:hypothetical protein